MPEPGMGGSQDSRSGSGNSGSSSGGGNQGGNNGGEDRGMSPGRSQAQFGTTEFAGKTFQLDSGFGDAEIRLSGKPENGDVMTIERNTEGTGDNRNLLALIDIQTKDTLLGSSTSLQDVLHYQLRTWEFVPGSPS